MLMETSRDSFLPILKLLPITPEIVLYNSPTMLESNWNRFKI